MPSNNACLGAYFLVCAHHNDRLGKYLHFAFRKPDHINGQTKRQTNDNNKHGLYAANDGIPFCRSRDMIFFH